MSAVFRNVGIALLATLLCACATRQPLRSNDPGSRPQAGTDEAELWYTMERAEAELKRSPQLVTDPALNTYVRDVACKVAAAYCSDLRVYIMDVPHFNASMAPNGVMLMWTGALLRMRDEAELAFVLAHETGHYAEQHSIQQWRRLKDTSAVLNAFQLVAFGAGAPNVAMLGALAGYATIFKYSRDMEREADQYGLRAVRERDYDSQAGVDLWARMLAEEESRPYQRRGVVFATHPPSRERLNDIRTVAASVGEQTRERNRDRYRDVMRPFLPRWLDENLGQRQYATSILVIGGLLADAPQADRALLTFYLGEAYRRRGQAGDDQRAAERYAQAVAMPDTPVEAWREHGFALRQQGRIVQAREALQRYLAQAPQADDRAFVQRELDTLGAGR